MKDRHAVRCRAVTRIHLALAFVVLSLGCQRASDRAPRPASAPAAGKPELIEASATGDVAAEVRTELERAKRDGHRLVVYVSATWCEPCKAFQKALKSGELDAYFPNLRLLKFDADRDNERVAYAGYDGQYIPRFVMPDAKGHASASRFEGGIKGEGGIPQMGRQLQDLMRN